MKDKLPYWQWYSHFFKVYLIYQLILVSKRS